MKKNFSIILLTTASIASAQWSNTTNYFADSLQMTVSTATLQQANPIVIRSYPDLGYIVIWQDQRNGFGNYDIYTQKYNKAGKRLWKPNGVPVATGVNVQQFWDNFKNFFKADYRNYSFACTDSADGFYIAWDEVFLLGSYARNRIVVQHVRSDGSVVFSNAGKIIAAPLEADNFNYAFPQLIADGRKGFFISFIKATSSEDFIYVRNYKDENGILKLYVSKLMNDNVYQKSSAPTACGTTHYYLQYGGPTVNNYQIWNNGQGGCNIIMNMNASDGTANIGGQQMLAYNALWRAKKNCTTLTYRRTSDIAETKKVVTQYKKDNIYQLYELQTFHYEDKCKVNEDVVVISNNKIENFGLGYKIIAEGSHSYFHAKGVTMPTAGNINIDAYAAVSREIINNQLTDLVTKLYAAPAELYDSIPYQLRSFNPLYTAYNINQPAGMNKLDNFRDTILTTGISYSDFSLAASGNKIHATTLLWHNIANPYEVYLQQLKIMQSGPKKFTISYNTPYKGGRLIGRNVSTCCQGSNINYYDPSISTDQNGNALFHITEDRRYVRVSPIDDGARLRWGAMGKPIGLNNMPGGDYVCMDGSNGTAVIAWHAYTLPTTDYDILTRHLDDLSTINYLPPKTLIASLPHGSNALYPNTLLSSSTKWSSFNAYSSKSTLTPAVEILDNYNLGVVQPLVYENTQLIRKYNGKPYLDRNYAILPEHNPSGSANISVRLYFTKAEFDALKAADAGITNPGSLVVIKQPNTTNDVPWEYTPVTGEKTIVPATWAAVEGGYYLEIKINGFSNFFIQKKGNGAMSEASLKLHASLSEKIYPNPATDKLYVSILKNFTTYEIIDVSGTIIEQNTTTTILNYISVKQLDAGIYFLKLINNNDTQTLKFIKR